MLIFILSMLYLLLVYFILRIFKFAATDDDTHFEYRKGHDLSSY